MVSAGGPRKGRRAGAAAILALVLGALALLVPGMAGARDARTAAEDRASVRLDVRHEPGGAVPRNFVGLSIEWSLVERYMGPAARPAFARLLANLDSGMLRIGGSSQDLMPFEPDAANANSVITPEDLSYIRSTLDAVDAGDGDRARPSWGVVLGTAMAPPSSRRPFVSPDHARTFVREGVAPAFSGAAREVAGIELGNEPDLSYGSSGVDRYRADLATYSAPDVTGPFGVIVPNTSEDILPWESVDGRSVPTRWFWNWPEILDTGADQMRARAGAYGAWASDHFYPLARTCTNKPYRCPSIGALLSREHMDSLDYQVYEHAREAARHGLDYRLEETNTAAGRGADGVSNVAASATYALSAMFHAACPQLPADPDANSGCGTGAIGVNFHNAEVRAFFAPEEGNAYYNAIDYDPTPAMGAPKPAPEYYAMLLFGRLAQGARGLRPASVSGAPGLEAWRLEGRASARRLFLVNKSQDPVTVDVAVPAARVRVDRLTPYDPTGAGRTLDAPEVRVDGRQVADDGSWPGLDPAVERVHGGHVAITVGPGEVAVVRAHGRRARATTAAADGPHFTLAPGKHGTGARLRGAEQGFSVETADFAHGFLTRPRLAGWLRTLGHHGVIRLGGYSMDLVWPAFGPWAGTAAPDWAIGGTVDQGDLDALRALLDATGWKVTLGAPLKSVLDGDVSLDQVVAEVNAVRATLGDRLLAVELGNEYDHVTTLDAAGYYEQLKRYAAAIRAAGVPIRMAGPSANTSTSNTKLDDFVSAVTADTSTDPVSLLEEVTSHWYPGSHCGHSTTSIASLMSAATHVKTRTKLDGIMAIGARLGGDVPMVINESNSASCSGQAGVSDSYATALWSLDYLLETARSGVQRLQFHTSTAALCGRLEARDSPLYPISYRFYAAFCAPDQAALDGNRLAAAPLYYGLWAFREVPEGRFVPLDLPDETLPSLRAYAVKGHGRLSVVLINVQDPAAGGADDVVDVRLPKRYRSGGAVTLASSAPGGLASTDASAITLGGESVSSTGEASGRPQATRVRVDGRSAIVTVAPGTAQIVSFGR